MKKLIVILLVILTNYGCEKDNTIYFSSNLIGEWSWFISCGGVIGDVRPSEDNTINLLFTSDSILYTYRNDTLYSSNIFHTYKRFSDDGMDTINILTYSSSIQKYWIYHDTLSLELTDFRMGSGFKRIKQIHFP
jgi:hypothetical protein